MYELMLKPTHILPIAMALLHSKPQDIDQWYALRQAKTALQGEDGAFTLESSAPDANGRVSTSIQPTWGKLETDRDAKPFRLETAAFNFLKSAFEAAVKSASGATAEKPAVFSYGLDDAVIGAHEAIRDAKKVDEPPKSKV